MPQPRAIVPDSSVRGCKNADANNDIPAKRIVKFDGSNGVDAVALATAATEKYVGVTMETITKGSKWGDVQVAGRAVVTAGVAIAIGDRITSGASGKAAVWAPAGGTNNSVLGVAMSAASGDGVDFECELWPPGSVAQG